MDIVSVPRDVPHGLFSGIPISARVVMGLIAKARHGSLDVRVPDGRIFRFEGEEPGPNASITINDWRFIRRCMRSWDIGVGESYMAGEWTSPDVTAFLRYFATNHEIQQTGLAGPLLMRMWQRLRHLLNSNTRRGSRRNISAHYDLGNDFYGSWLDSTMTYSSALYQTGAEDLPSAQRAKYRALAEDIGIKPDHKVLEIGCGFGGFAEYVASEIGANVTALTISRKQFDFARERIQKAGLGGKANIVMRDYRDETGVYDRIASIEMFEAVGERYWSAYFEKVSQCLSRDGRAGLQIITVQDRFFEVYRRAPDFIQRYIFPGGMLPPPSTLRELGSNVGMNVIGERIFGHDYARTLVEWREQFREAWPRIKSMGFDDRFKRMWEFYLHYCEAGFRSEFIDVRQIVYVKS